MTKERSLMEPEKVQSAVKTCYSTWSGTYYDDYYGPKAAYPPVHRDLLKRLLSEANVRSVLDAGCGPASFLRELAGLGLDLYGFDVTPEMVAEARRVLRARGVPEDHVWQGSVLVPDDFRPRAAELARTFDAAVCVGVLPHVPAAADGAVLANLRDAVRPGGLVVVEARNQFFALFTLNRYSHQFFVEELIRAEELRRQAGAEARQLDEALEALRGHFRMDLPPVRKGKRDEPGYDEVLSRTHNPLLLRQQFADAGFADVRLLFYHYHCLPPLAGAAVPELMRRASLALEADPEDWRGYFMASAFVVTGTRR
jgi:SAM-dependent methyltransferase